MEEVIRRPASSLLYVGTVPAPNMLYVSTCIEGTIEGTIKGGREGGREGGQNFFAVTSFLNDP